MKILLVLAALMAVEGARGSCAAQPGFTASMRITSVTATRDGGCWLRGEWQQDGDKAASKTPLFTRAATLCAAKVPATKKVRGSHDCCDAGSMPPPCGWGTDKALDGYPSGIQVTPAE